MKKYIAVVATAAAAISYGSVASANGTVTKTAECPPVHHPHHHHKHHAHHAHHAAPHCPPCPCIRSGFFAGLNGGYGWAKGKLHSNVGANGNLLRVKRNTTLGADGGLVGVHLGYDHVFHNHAVLGLEAGARWSDLSGHSNTNVGFGPGNGTPDRVHHVKFRTRDEYQLALRAGRVFHQCWLGYGKIGAEWTKLKLQTRSSLNDANGNSLGGKSRSKYRTGLLLALGFDTPVTQHFWFGAEYSYTRYQKLSVSRSVGNSQDFARAKIRPYSNKIIARLSWRQ